LSLLLLPPSPSPYNHHHHHYYYYYYYYSYYYYSYYYYYYYYYHHQVTVGLIGNYGTSRSAVLLQACYSTATYSLGLIPGLTILSHFAKRIKNALNEVLGLGLGLGLGPVKTLMRT